MDTMDRRCSSVLLVLLVAFVAGTTAFVRPQEMCSQRLGCFPTDYPWWSHLRPVPAPQTPEEVGTTFLLFTRRNKWTEQHIPTDSLEKLIETNFDADRRTFFITHGFVSSGRAAWVMELKDALLERVDANVFVTDWARGAGEISRYLAAAANTRVVGREMAKLIEYAMEETGLHPRDVHLIGHSLGAHASSYCAKEVQNIDKLTALDPAQPLFEGYDRTVRLDSSDAYFVEVVHTDSQLFLPNLGFGMVNEHGHVDYYVNAGLIQPGCLIPKDLHLSEGLWALKKRVAEYFLSCPHTRAAEVYIEAVRNTDCTFWGHPQRLFKILAGALSLGHLHRHITPSDNDCESDTCSPLGLDNEKYPARGIFIVPTSSSKPYCIHEPNVDAMMRRYKRID